MPRHGTQRRSRGGTRRGGAITRRHAAVLQALCDRPARGAAGGDARARAGLGPACGASPHDVSVIRGSAKRANFGRFAARNGLRGRDRAISGTSGSRKLDGWPKCAVFGRFGGSHAGSADARWSRWPPGRSQPRRVRFRCRARGPTRRASPRAPWSCLTCTVRTFACRWSAAILAKATACFADRDEETSTPPWPRASSPRWSAS